MLCVALALFASAAPAQQTEVQTDAPSALLERGTVRLRYGVSLRQGQQQDVGPGVVYNGMTPNDVALSATWFPVGLFGGALSVQREGFSLLDEGERVTGGGLVRASAGPVARVLLGPLKLEGHVGYQFAQLPAFDSSVRPNLAPATRHGVLLASRVAVGLPMGIIAEARGELPVALAVSDASGAAARSSGFAGGGGLSFPVYSTDSTDWRVALDYQYVRDEVVTAAGATSAQTLSRVGAAIQVDLLPPGVPRPPKFGGVQVLVIADDTGQPLPDAAVTLEVGDGGAQPLAVSEGRGAAEGLSPGRATAKVTAPGYLPAQADAEIVAGQVATLEVRAKKEPPKVGALTVKVVDKTSGAPIEGAQIKLGDRALTTDPSGVATAEALPPGNVSVQIEAPGYKQGDEVAQVVVGRTSELPVALVKERQKVPATISGLVRSTRGGKPIRARLLIPELSLDVRADESGAFSVEVPSGTFRVIISAPGFRQQTKQVTTREGDQTIFNVDLHPRGR